MNAKYKELVEKLKEIFELDKPELDFGIYRILHSRSKQINDFLDNRLQAKVREALTGNKAAQIARLEQELQKARANAENLGIADVDSTPKVQELKAQLEQFGNAEQSENEVYSHLLTFFSRYYDKGDFISLRRYKGDTYAIPYSGEEVKLHWANADQYYIKTSENFSHYDFALKDGAKVHFRLISAQLTKDNIKDNDAVRCFVLWNPEEAANADGEYPSSPIEEKDGELYVYFQYRRFKKGTNQKEKLDAATRAFFAALVADSQLYQRFAELDSEVPTEKDRHRKLFRKHLDAYTAKNKSDYFIHKDLKKFLSTELDFYIKNEMMNLDDIQQASTFAQIESGLRVIQAARTIATALIDFMSQLEDFQKKLWLKKKFVMQCEYCVTMDMVPSELHASVLSNTKQMEEWKSLNTDIQPEGSVDARIIDTRFFDAEFKAKLLSSIDGIDAKCGGLVIHSENAAALRLLKKKYNTSIDAIYIDPPYNTGNDNDFLYKDNYQHSSWISCMKERAELSKELMTPLAAIWVSTDDGEYANVKSLFDSIYGESNFVADVIWNSRKSVSNDALLSVSINHTTLFARNKKELDSYKSDFRLEEDGSGFSNPDNDPRGPWKADPMDAPNVRVNLSYAIENPVTKEKFYPPQGRHWRFEKQETEQLLADGRILFGVSGTGKPQYKRFLSEAQAKGKVAKTLWEVWDDVDTTTEATKMLAALFGNTLAKSTIDKIKPKPVLLVERIGTLNMDSHGIMLDYFAGSGTTGHAVLSLNRKDNGSRGYVMVEMGEHFDTILLPRLKKIVYSPKWKDGEATSKEKGISHCFKYMTLESYEDTLNNLKLESPAATPDLLHDDYLLHYMLDIESRGSLINTDSFQKPFDYKLKVSIDSSGAAQEQRVDLPETFNYLLGLTVLSYDYHLDKGYLMIEGTLPSGDKALVIWRDMEKVDDERLHQLMEQRDIRPGSSEFDLIYVNGDHSLDNHSVSDEENAPTLKIRSLENEFLNLMFTEE